MAMVSKKDAPQVPTEVLPKAKRRTFTTAYKLDVLLRADRCKGDGDIGELLRKEGLYSSLLTTWRAARASGELNAKSTGRRGPKPVEHDPRDREIEELKRNVAKLTVRAERAEQLVELQKKVAELLGTFPETEERRGKR